MNECEKKWTQMDVNTSKYKWKGKAGETCGADHEMHCTEKSRKKKM